MGMTKQEKQANSIAKHLVKALNGIEDYDGDPNDIFEDAQIVLVGTARERKLTCIPNSQSVLNYLRGYYNPDELEEE